MRATCVNGHGHARVGESGRQGGARTRVGRGVGGVGPPRRLQSPCLHEMQGSDQLGVGGVDTGRVAGERCGVGKEDKESYA